MIKIYGSKLQLKPGIVVKIHSCETYFKSMYCLIQPYFFHCLYIHERQTKITHLVEILPEAMIRLAPIEDHAGKDSLL